MKNKLIFMMFFLLSVLTMRVSSQVSPVKFIARGVIRIDDNTLTDWKDIEPVYSSVCTDQWRQAICEKAPDPCRSDRVDLQTFFYLAWDGTDLLFAVDVIDDSVLSVAGDDKHLYRGDSAELFFVEECATQSDYHDCVSQDKPVFQLLLCPGELNNKRTHFAEYRTPERIIQNALQKDGFQAIGWKTSNGWQAEAVFPLSALSKEKARIRGGKRVKISFDVLDYDLNLAEWEEPCWGFEPDHVVSNVQKQEMAANPIRMTEFVLETSK